MNRLTEKLLLLALFANGVLGWPNKEVEKREYKTMLKPMKFRGSEDEVISKLQALRSALIDVAKAAKAKEDSSSSDFFSLKTGMPRTVKFYDTRSCQLNTNGWAFRMRRKTGETNWEGTFKMRSWDRYLSSHRMKDMDKSCGSNDLEDKFEEDVTLAGTSKFSYSHKCMIRDKKNINKLQDIKDTWSDWDGLPEWSMETGIELVGGKTITERVYKGLVIDFDDGGKQDLGEFSVTLWYDSSTSTDPSLAEMSFTIESTGNSLEDWNSKTIETAHRFWKECSKLTSWLDPNSSTKTAWVYDGWCSSNSHAGMIPETV